MFKPRRGRIIRGEALAFPPLPDSEAPEVKDDRLKPITETGKGVTNDRYSKSDSARPRVAPKPVKA